MTYPKWVQRAPDIGAVLCLSEAEERELLEAWRAEHEAQEDSAAAPDVPPVKRGPGRPRKNPD